VVTSDRAWGGGNSPAKSLYQTPRSRHRRVAWDVGPSGLPHKLITGRLQPVHTLRKQGRGRGYLENAPRAASTISVLVILPPAFAAWAWPWPVTAVRDSNGVAVIGMVPSPCMALEGDQPCRSSAQTGLSVLNGQRHVDSHRRGRPLHVPHRMRLSPPLHSSRSAEEAVKNLPFRTAKLAD